MTKFLKSAKIVTLLVVVTIISSYFHTATAQDSTATRVSVVADASKTNIWVSGFPKKTSVVVTDIENNLLTIISTNDFGAAFFSLPLSVKTGITVKTLDGEISTSNNTVIKNKQEENVVSNANTDLNKA